MTPGSDRGRTWAGTWAWPRACLVALLLATGGCSGQGRGMAEGDTFTNPAAADLARAVAAGDAAAAKQAVAAGANPDAVDADGLPLLQWAMKRGDRRAFDLLLDLGADPARGAKQGQTAVGLAAMGQQDTWLVALLDRGASPDTPNTVNGSTPLTDALRTGNLDHVRLLLDRGADIEARNRSGHTPLIAAAGVNDADAVLLLLEAGADPTATAGNGADFQDYLHKGDPKLLNAGAKRARDRIDALLRERGIAVKRPAG